MSSPLLQFTPKGIYCPQADVYIDPWKKVKKALITHGHSDHAKRGHNQYISTNLALPTIAHRLGKINITGVEFGEEIRINGVKISFHPAGHIIGSAQIRLEHQGIVWVVSGDYKVDQDGFTRAFEPIKCDHFITESTFGRPIYRWKSSEEVSNQINEWWAHNKSLGLISIIQAYSLGKAQRLIHLLDSDIGKIYTTDAIEDTNAVLRSQGVNVKTTFRINDGVEQAQLNGHVIIGSSTGQFGSWFNDAEAYKMASASGWMMHRKMRKNRNVDKGFVLSDHADWDGLLEAVNASQAENIYVTHGFSETLSRYLTESGWNAQILKTSFDGESL